MTIERPPPADVTRARRHGIADLLTRSATRTPDRTAIVAGTSRRTYAELDEQVRRTAVARPNRPCAAGRPGPAPRPPGRPGLNVETRVVDEDDNPLPPGHVGEIVHRGPHTMYGYWNDPERTAEAFRGGWFHSGDLGRFDEDGYLYVVDRKKDMVNTGGENVSGREVEEVLHTHPDVVEAAVFGVPHPYWVEAVTAAVVLRPGAGTTGEELIEHCAATLARFKVPKTVVLAASLPRNPSGKVLKRDLREHWVDPVPPRGGPSSA